MLLGMWTSPAQKAAMDVCVLSISTTQNLFLRRQKQRLKSDDAPKPSCGECIRSFLFY